MRVGECCNRAVVVARRNTGITQAAQLMREFHVGTLVVVDSDGERARPAGMVTDRDLVMEVLAECAPVDSLTVGDIMTSDILTARLSDELLDTLDRMGEGGVRRVPVVDSDGGLAGILSVDDVLGMLADAVGRVPRLVRCQLDSEAVRRP
ncbi:MAG: CBS domain-containing protein [Nevskia sp.]|nr:CBS domain-containing protein [Nevskia sp.]